MFPFCFWADDNNDGGDDAYSFISQYVIVIILIPLSECHVLDKYDGKQGNTGLASRSAKIWTYSMSWFRRGFTGCVSKASSVLWLYSVNKCVNDTTTAAAAAAQ